MNRGDPSHNDAGTLGPVQRLHQLYNISHMGRHMLPNGSMPIPLNPILALESTRVFGVPLARLNVHAR